MPTIHNTLFIVILHYKKPDYYHMIELIFAHLIIEDSLNLFYCHLMILPRIFYAFTYQYLITFDSVLNYISTYFHCFALFHSLICLATIILLLFTLFLFLLTFDKFDIC